MSSVLHFRKRLDVPPVELEVDGIAVRYIAVPADVTAWLKLRDRAVAWLKPAARSWMAADFESEMLRKSWWRNDRTWLAVPTDLSAQLVGTVTLALRETPTKATPVVHWLLVDPAWRRRGLGRLLISHLERAVWETGWREIQLETHAGWSAAVAFYQSMGYAPLRDPPPR